MINTATPLRKPVITALETKRTMNPSRNSPASSCITPTISTSAASAAALCASGTSTNPAPAATESALVGETFMNTELVNRAPMGTATISV